MSGAAREPRRKRIDVRALALPALAALALAGCGAAPTTDSPPMRDRNPNAVTGTQWRWERMLTPVEEIAVPDPSRYTIELAPNGRVLVRADCNRGTGTYTIAEGKLSFGPIATTRMACPPGSLDARYLRDLQRASSFFVEDGKLYLELPVDSGTLRFGRAQ